MLHNKDKQPENDQKKPVTYLVNPGSQNTGLEHRSEMTSRNAWQSEKKRVDSFPRRERIELYLTNESETDCSPLITSWAKTCLKLKGAQGRNSFIAAEKPAEDKGKELDNSG